MTEDLSKQVDAIISDRNRLSVELEAVKQDYAVAHAEIERLRAVQVDLMADRDRSLKRAAELTAILDNVCTLAMNATRIGYDRRSMEVVDIEEGIKELVHRERSVG